MGLGLGSDPNLQEEQRCAGLARQLVEAAVRVCGRPCLGQHLLVRVRVRVRVRVSPCLGQHLLVRGRGRGRGRGGSLPWPALPAASRT